MKLCRAGLLLMPFLAVPTMQSQTPPAAKPSTSVVAATPPMGWNSWDSYGLTITEDQFRANVKVLHNGLMASGYNYAVIDEGWFFFNPQDRPHSGQTPLRHRRQRPLRSRPCALPIRGYCRRLRRCKRRKPPGGTPYKLLATTESTSFKPLADWVHAQGLKFGIHIVRGIPRASVERNLPIAGSAFHAADAADTTDACPWDPTNWGVKNNAAGQAWYDSLLSQYAGWGVDFLKVDCIAAHPYKADEIQMIRRAIDKTGRPMVLSLSPGPTSLDNAAEVGKLAQMWRISNDFWDVWATDPGKTFPQSLSGQFALAAAWAPFAKPGNWPDADMLPLGQIGPVPGSGAARHTRFTPDEQQTLITLWAMARSPLILGANLTQLDDPTYKLLTNRDVIAIDQTATRSGEVLHSGDIIAWTADLPANFPDGYTSALALFNVGEGLVTISASFEVYGMEDDTYHVQDVWAGKSLGKLKSIDNLSLEPHTSTLLLLKK